MKKILNVSLCGLYVESHIEFSENEVVITRNHVKNNPIIVSFLNGFLGVFFFLISCTFIFINIYFNEITSIWIYIGSALFVFPLLLKMPKWIGRLFSPTKFASLWRAWTQINISPTDVVFSGNYIPEKQENFKPHITSIHPYIQRIEDPTYHFTTGYRLTISIQNENGSIIASAKVQYNNTKSVLVSELKRIRDVLVQFGYNTKPIKFKKKKETLLKMGGWLIYYISTIVLMAS